MNSTPNTDFLLEFFGSFGCDPSGHGEGQFQLTSFTVTTNSQGTIFPLFLWPVSLPYEPGIYITGVAHGPNGTSEFSPCILFDILGTGGGRRAEPQAVADLVPFATYSVTTVQQPAAFGQHNRLPHPQSIPKSDAASHLSVFPSIPLTPNSSSAQGLGATPFVRSSVGHWQKPAQITIRDLVFADETEWRSSRIFVDNQAIDGDGFVVG
jgi:hypothetical protein